MKGLLFKPWKAQAIHESNPEIEWQTRRIIKPQPDSIYHSPIHLPGTNGWAWHKPNQGTIPFIRDCPFSVDEEVYIKEPHYRYGRWVRNGLTKTGKQAWTFKPTTDEVLFADDVPRKLHPNCSRQHLANLNISDWYKRSSLFLPADLARTVVTITGVGAQRVQDISEDDAIAEGSQAPVANLPKSWQQAVWTERQQFSRIWDSIHGPDAWERNDFVWKYSFIRRDYETTE